MGAESTTALAAFVVALALAVTALLVVLFLAGLSLGRRRGKAEAERDLAGLVDRERGDAVKRSRAILTGQAAEQLAPWLPGFPYDPSECRFIGKPVDFLVFRGAASGAVEEVVFVEVKSGNASLNRVERSLRDAVVAGKVSWAEYRAP
jgi:predicted Holliday junction resolvase-like endonuclease